MSRFSTLIYLINSHYSGKKELDIFQDPQDVFDKVMNADENGFEPSQKSLDAILSFASQYDVLKSEFTGIIELNLN